MGKECYNRVVLTEEQQLQYDEAYYGAQMGLGIIILIIIALILVLRWCYR